MNVDDTMTGVECNDEIFSCSFIAFYGGYVFSCIINCSFTCLSFSYLLIDLCVKIIINGGSCVCTTFNLSITFSGNVYDHLFQFISLFNHSCLSLLRLTEMNWGLFSAILIPGIASLIIVVVVIISVITTVVCVMSRR